MTLANDLEVRRIGPPTKNPGCANNRGSPLCASGNSSYQILRFPNAPAEMIFKSKTAYGDDADALSYRLMFRFLRFQMRADICWPNDKATLEKLTSLPDDDKNILKELRSLQAVTNDFRSYIEPARHKLLAHLDRTAVLSGKPLGGFPEGKDRTFFDALQRICNITHEACFGTICGDMIPIPWGGGDVISLRRTLEEAVAFKKALSESSGQTERWLYSCLEKARHDP